MKTYWWRKTPDGGSNFGDELGDLILTKMGHDHTWAPPASAELVTAGSVLEHLPERWAGSVCGTGKLHEHSTVDLSSARVFALRGKLTERGVTGLKSRPVLGDPGLLVPRWHKQTYASHDLGVLPHWSDRELRQRFSYGRFIDPGWPAEKVIAAIAACKRLVTSSLHGAIIADAYSIPRQLELPATAATEGGDFKHRDYTSIYDTHPHFGQMFTAPRHIVERAQRQLFERLTWAAGIDLPDEPAQRRKPQISLLVPFRDDGEHRSTVWKWMRAYWRARHLNAEIIQGHDDGMPFSKACAVNQAATLARADILAILDADAYLNPADLTACADTIDDALRRGKHLWYMPYDHIYRLSRPVTEAILATTPSGPVIDDTPQRCDLEQRTDLADPSQGHPWGAMAQIMPAEAFRLVGGMDPRFRGWGAEDVSLLRSLDTCYGLHHVHPGQLLHLWHARTGDNWKDRRWVGQTFDTANTRLSQRYANAAGEPGFMKALTDEHPLPEPHI